MSICKKLFVLILASSFVSLKSQNAGGVAINNHFIEVTGTSETEVTPDEIFISITLTERNDSKDKMSIEKQESELKKSIKDLGIDAGNLTLLRADADYRKIRTFKKDVQIVKSYILKVSSAEVLAKVYEQLDRLNAQDAYVAKYSHTKILELQKENRIKAIQASKEKVDYLLAAIGQKAGQALQINESANYVDDGSFNNRRNTYANVAQSYSDAEAGAEADPISFKKIKIRASFLVKYEILNK